MATNSKHSYWDNISKIVQNSACDTFPGSRSYLMKRLNLFFGDVLRDWVLKQGVWLTIFFISKQLLVQSLHDQDHIWWKVSNFSSEMFLEIGYWSKMFDWHFCLSQNNFLYKVFMNKIRSDEKFQTFLRRRS